MKNFLSILLCMILSLPLTLAAQGTYGDYSAWTKLSFLSYNASSEASHESRGSGDQIVGVYSASLHSGRFGVFQPNTPPPTPNLTSPSNNTQQIYNNLTFEWTNVTDDDGDAVTFEIRFLDNSFTNLGGAASIETTNYTNTTLPDGWIFWQVRSYDSKANSDWSNPNYVDNVNSSITLTAPTEGQVLRPGNSLTITANQSTRSDWITNFTILTGSNDCNAVNDSSEESSTWSCIYTAATNANSQVIDVNAYGYNNTPEENITTSTYFYIIKTTGPAVTTPRIIRFYPNVTYADGNQLIGITLNVDMDVLNKSIVLTVTYPNSNTTTLNPDVIADLGNFDYNYNYSFYPTEADQEYSFEVSATDQNDETNTSSFRIYVKNVTSVNLTTTGGNTINIKDINSGISLTSGTTINETFTPGEYNIEITTNVQNVTIYNATINNSDTKVLEYLDKDESVTPTNTRAIDRFTLSSDIAYGGNVEVHYNYGTKNASVTYEDNILMYKCESESNCTWQQLSATIDTTNDIMTATIPSFSVFIIAENTATSTSSVQASSGGGSGGSSSRVIEAKLKVITTATSTTNPLKMLLKDSMKVPILIKNPGEQALEGIKIRAVNEAGITLKLNKDYITRLDVGASEIIMATITSDLDKPGNHTIKIISAATAPPITDDSELVVEIITAIEEKYGSITSRVVFAKDLFKENPECLELQELLEKAEEAIKKGDYERARSLTETAIIGCEDLITSLTGKKEVISKPAFTNQQLIIFMVVGSSILTIVIIIIITPRRYRLFEKIRRKKTKVKGKYKKDAGPKPSEAKEGKRVDIWKRPK